MILDLDRHHPPWTYRLLSTWDAYRFNLAVSDRRVNENFYNLFFESGARNFQILLCILPVPFFDWMARGENQCSLLLLLFNCRDY